MTKIYLEHLPSLLSYHPAPSHHGLVEAMTRLLTSTFPTTICLTHKDQNFFVKHQPDDITKPSNCFWSLPLSKSKAPTVASMALRNTAPHRRSWLLFLHATLYSLHFNYSGPLTRSACSKHAPVPTGWHVLLQITTWFVSLSFLVSLHVPPIREVSFDHLFKTLFFTPCLFSLLNFSQSQPTDIYICLFGGGILPPEHLQHKAHQWVSLLCSLLRPGHGMVPGS